MTDQDTHYLKRALALAKKALGQTWPNPCVGAVIVKDGKIVGEGFHKKAGEPHAEVNALANASENVTGATIYVTLEPCCHFGKTPPCTDAIVEAGIERVVFSHRDTNPQVANQSTQILKAHGIEVRCLCLDEIEAFYKPYDFWRENQRPWLCAKLAVSKDGAVADANGQRIKITGPEADAFTHQQRDAFDAILTSAKTVMIDDPLMNVRLNDEVKAKPVFIMDREARLSQDVALWHSASQLNVIYGPTADMARVQALYEKGAQCLLVNEDQYGLVWSEVLAHIGAQGVHRLWLEAGATLFHSAWDQKVLQEAYLYMSPNELDAKAVTIPKALLEANSWMLGEDRVFHLT